MAWRKCADVVDGLDAYQLRGHLATLKLATAAEHLPGVLDQAQAED